MNIVTRLEKQNKLYWVLFGSSLVILIGIVDFLTGYELAFSLFYLIPIFFTDLVWGEKCRDYGFGRQRSDMARRRL